MSTPFRLHRARLETLVDGVFAIAMTILVLEIKVPELADRNASGELLTALAHHGYVIGAYFFSFAMLGLFWVWHHRLAEKVRELDLPLLVCALCFLALVCFFPFASALLGRYPANLAALLIYVPVIGAILLMQTLFFWIAMRRGLLVESLGQDERLRTHKRNLRGLAIFCIASVPTALRLSVVAAPVCAAIGAWLFWCSRHPKGAAEGDLAR